jgi:hypothetical protein
MQIFWRVQLQGAIDFAVLRNDFQIECGITPNNFTTLPKAQKRKAFKRAGQS